jgi:hypothetical protein
MGQPKAMLIRRCSQAEPVKRFELRALRNTFEQLLGKVQTTILTNGLFIRKSDCTAVVVSLRTLVTTLGSAKSNAVKISGRDCEPPERRYCVATSCGSQVGSCFDAENRPLSLSTSSFLSSQSKMVPHLIQFAADASSVPQFPGIQPAAVRVPQKTLSGSTLLAR